MRPVFETINAREEEYISYISHEGISGGRERDGTDMYPEPFRTRDAHRKSHQ